MVCDQRAPNRPGTEPEANTDRQTFHSSQARNQRIHDEPYAWHLIACLALLAANRSHYRQRWHSMFPISGLQPRVCSIAHAVSEPSHWAVRTVNSDANDICTQLPFTLVTLHV